MCYLLRQQQPGAERGAAAPSSPGLDRLRPRWVGGAAAMLVAGLAVAALVAPTPTAPGNDKDAAAPVARLSTTAAAPAGPVVEQRSLPVDDDVPTAPATMKAGIGHCHEGL